MVDTQGNLKYELDVGIETVESNGKSYIVHPAFMNDTESAYSHGGWTGDLAGIWIGKYETSGSSSDMKIVPNAEPQNPNISNCYTYSFNYDRDKESHLMKNSEWGAVAYLTHSQYGRDGNEIYANNETNLTGNSSGNTNPNASSDNYSYNTPEGQKASSTGNIYGIYDLSGGCYEYVAAFNTTSTSYKLNTYGGSFASKGGQSTPYATAYINGTTTNSGTKIYEVGKTGDATKEVYLGSGSTNWNKDYSYFLSSPYPFFTRGGTYSSSSSAGVFYSYRDDSARHSNAGFRVVLGGAAL